MAEMVRQLSCRLNGVHLAPATEALAIARRGGAWRIEIADGGAIEADAVIIAVPSSGAARLLEGIDRELGDTLGAIPNASTAVIHLGFRQRDVEHDLDGYGYVIPRVEGSDLLACTWSSSKWESRAPRGMVLLRLYTRRLADDEELEALARGELKDTMGIDGAPVLARVFRWPHAMPQYTLEHPARLETIEKHVAGLEGIFLAGASYRGVGIPDCIESGFRAARAAMEYLE
jgi:oxygen-dependent protoporphyrinogen oxidase